jgi:uncharacterized membrane protein
MTLSGRRAVLVLAVLVVSLCVNVFAAGLLAGRWWGGRDGHDGPRGRPAASLDVERLTERAPPEARPHLREAFRERRPEAGERMRALGAARREAAAAVRAEPFDPARLDAALSEVRDRTSEVQAVLHRGLGEALARMPPDVRRFYGEAVFSRERRER